MNKLIDLDDSLVRHTISILLKDHTTGMNIIWATDTYAGYQGCADTEQITALKVIGVDHVPLAPRINKSVDEQQARTRKRAEVFTPVWICNLMNNYADEEWFGRQDVFNHLENTKWTVTESPITFPEGKTWKDYVDSRRLEITCGEAPYLVSRYDVADGEMILPPLRRIGLLDRKIRIVNENTKTYRSWLIWMKRAYESCYGYEYQGDSLLLARLNLMMTFDEYYFERWHKFPSLQVEKSIAEIISWNLWQMDGLSDTVPLGKPKPMELTYQRGLFDTDSTQMQKSDREDDREAPFCLIKNWRTKETIKFHDLKEKL